MRGAAMRPVQHANAVTAEGLQDDANRGRRKRQVLLIELETLLHFGLRPGDVRENIVVAGITIAGTAPGTRIHAGHVELEVTTDCSPCDYIDSLRPGLQRQIRGRRGTLCHVIHGGAINVGDPVALIGQPRN